ncbi:GmrSD restriction endonuclease domain-containing protein [Streptomyces paludis]|uniref:DUF262 domain-containing protein n=1 Tax=Streptomyces paludis TaxID=2282738 RepID=A0A345HX66_9ACTN|nr:DUF262 domain-containing protein [Streptomyces paludis]AXG81290.1 DUF262 domain-containing protein [Streptomyces paludis]
MRAQEITFLKLVQGEKQFQVPLYQRTYSWRRTHLERLWEDVRELVDEQLGSDTPHPPHFLGSVVLAPGLIQAGGVQRWLIVDGQQRLTTLMLAFISLRDHYKDSGNARAADRVHRQILVNEFHEGNGHYRLLPTQADRAAYTACMGSTPQAGGSDNIGNAYRYFRGVFANGAAENGDGWAPTVETVLKDLLSIVEITAQAGDNVYRIFESINNTGEGLRQSDLLRNYVFMLLPTRGERVYAELWLPMQQQLGPQRLELLAWLDLVVRGRNKVTQTEVYREQQTRLEPLANDEAALEQEIAALAERGDRLLRVLEPERERSAPLRSALRRLVDWGGRTHLPLALHLLDLVDTGQTTAEDAAEALLYVESYLVRRLICQTPTNSLTRIFMDAPKELERDRPTAEAVRRFLSSPRRRWPADDVMRQAMRSKPFYWSGQPQQRRLVLRRLEESYGSAEPVDFTKAKLSIEHVLPQKPSREWLDLLAEETEVDQSPKELHDLLVHTIGNLTLSGENTKLSNHPFRRKQEIYDSSALRMNQEIATSLRWGRAEIMARADRLAERAAALWPGPVGSTATADDTWAGWQELRTALVAMPSGTWTTYGDIAELIGSHPKPVGNHLASTPEIIGAFRVLTSDGRVSPAFRWLDGRDDTPQGLLEQEGVPFDAAGRGHSSHRLSAAELATLIGKEVPQDAVHDPLPEGENTQAAHRFETQLAQNQPEAAAGVLAALAFWRRQGGYLEYGRHDETSCFPMLDAGTASKEHRLWPMALYPVTGVVEVVFQYLKDRAPFDDTEHRRQLLRRLNEIDGIDLPESKLELRPSFPLQVFAKHDKEISAVLEWFVHAAALDLSRRP